MDTVLIHPNGKTSIGRSDLKVAAAEFFARGDVRNFIESIEVLALNASEQIAADKLPKPLAIALGWIEQPINKAVVSATDKALGGAGQTAPTGGGALDLSDLVRQAVQAELAKLQQAAKPPQAK